MAAPFFKSKPTPLLMLGLAKRGTPSFGSIHATKRRRIFCESKHDAGCGISSRHRRCAREGSRGNQRAYERFYNSLALFSSVTYLGYLKTLSKPISHQKWLVA